MRPSRRKASTRMLRLAALPASSVPLLAALLKASTWGPGAADDHRASLRSARREGRLNSATCRSSPYSSQTASSPGIPRPTTTRAISCLHNPMDVHRARRPRQGSGPPRRGHRPGGRRPRPAGVPEPPALTLTPQGIQHQRRRTVCSVVRALGLDPVAGFSRGTAGRRRRHRAPARGIPKRDRPQAIAMWQPQSMVGSQWNSYESVAVERPIIHAAVAAEAIVGASAMLLAPQAPRARLRRLRCWHRRRPSWSSTHQELSLAKHALSVSRRPRARRKPHG